MQLNTLLDKIKSKSAEDPVFRDSLLSAYEGDDPIADFCRLCQNAGIEIYPMDIADADDSVYAAMRRSTNGGGENSPHLGWEEDIFGNFIADLRQL
ncbi:MAG: hypothetical protein K6B14_11890 [Lachnospiraceae bacterium]|nr:hypothetical protein [Lachnospiraceae bacterium]